LAFSKSKTERTIPKPNYQFEKRKKDMERKFKQEEKRLRKLDKGINDSSEKSVEVL